jgi:23S rRNA pseudouridine1911/1915/1917 synthase
MINEKVLVPESMASQRLDKCLASLLPHYSRSRLQAWIVQGAVKIDGDVCTKARNLVTEGATITLNAEIPVAVGFEPQALPLLIVHQDADLLVINKPAGVVVHPGAGNPNGTLINALLFHYPELQQLPRAGIIHRLDKNTTGLLVVARSLPAHTALIRAMQAREIKRDYIALVYGELIAGATINAPIGRHPFDRIRMAVREDGREAITHYRIKEKFLDFTLLLVQLETGRTHQIRVHLAHHHHPIVGDPTYARLKLPKTRGNALFIDLLQHFRRQALHAWQLSFLHPITAQPLKLQAALPDDFVALLEALRKQNE